MSSVNRYAYVYTIPYTEQFRKNVLFVKGWRLVAKFIIFIVLHSECQNFQSQIKTRVHFGVDDPKPNEARKLTGTDMMKRKEGRQHTMFYFALGMRSAKCYKLAGLKPVNIAVFHPLCKHGLEKSEIRNHSFC